MRFRIILLLVWVFGITLFAQDKRFTLEEIMLQGRTKFAIKNINQLQWIADSDLLSFVDSLNADYGLIQHDITTDEKKLLLSLDTLNAAITQKKQGELKTFPVIHWIDTNTIRFWNEKNLLHYQLKEQTSELVNTIDPKAENIDPAPNHRYVAFTLENNLFIGFNPQTTRQITFDEEAGLVNGQTVHRVEFGINKGTFWSPQSNYLAYYHKDERMVSEYPLVDVETTPATLFTTRYPMAGQTSEQVQVAVYDCRTGSTLYLQTGEPKDQYLCAVVWSPDERFIYITHLNRDQNHLRVIQYDVRNGQPLKTLFEEQHPKYINPQQGIVFVDRQPNRFVWLSRRDGFNHIYLYEQNGKLIRQLTKGNWEVTDLIGFDHNGTHLFFTATSPDALERHAYRVHLQSGKMQKLTTAAGQHRVQPNTNGNLVLNRFSSMETPRRISVMDGSGKVLKTLLQAENPLHEYKTARTEFSKLVHNGTGLNTRLLYPTDFDPDKKYPAIVYVYGGPGAQMIHNRWLGGAGLWDHYLAQNGYFVFSIDNRGSANRGREFEQATFRRLGTIEVEDQNVGLQYLKSLPFIDSTRVGVFGWSYGGFMAISMMTRLPGQFKAAVSGAPVTDWKYYEVMYGERYMDTPQSNPEGYEESSTLNYINNLQGHLLIIHGTVDPTVVWQNSLAYLDQAIKHGKQVDYAVYPGHRHGIAGKDRLHLYQKITEYFRQNLQP